MIGMMPETRDPFLTQSLIKARKLNPPHPSNQRQKQFRLIAPPATPFRTPRPVMATKAALIKELKEAGVIFSEKETVPELKFRLQQMKEAEKGTGLTSRKIKSDFNAGLGSLRKQTVQEICAGLQIPIKQKSARKAKTKPELLLDIRQKCEELHDLPLDFGKLRGKTYAEGVLEKQYVEWAIEETKTQQGASSVKLRCFAMYCQLAYGGIKDEAETEELSEEDENEMLKPKQKPSKSSEDQDPKQNPVRTKSPERMKPPVKPEPTAPHGYTWEKKELKEKASPPTFKMNSSSESEYEKVPNSGKIPVEPQPPQWTGKPEDLEVYVRQAQEWHSMFGKESTAMDSAAKRKC